MRKLILILVCFGFSKIKAQAFTVGNTCCNYNLVNKVFALGSTTCATVSDSYAIDFDNDSQTDITIGAFNSPACFAGGASSHGISLLSTNCQFVYSTVISCPFRYPLNMTVGSPLIASLNWTVAPSTWNIGDAMPYIYYSYTNPSSFSYNCGTQANPFYLGFKKVLSTTTDTAYGWIRMDSNFPGKLFDYAYVIIGPLGIKDNKEYNDKFSIYPNPNNGEFQIKGTKEEMIFIFNELGQTLQTKHLNSQNNYSEKINDLPNGIYFVGNNSRRQKIVVIR